MSDVRDVPGTEAGGVEGTVMREGRLTDAICTSRASDGGGCDCGSDLGIVGDETAVATGVGGGSPVGGRSLSMRSENTVDRAFIVEGRLLPKEDVAGEVGTAPDIEPTRR